MTNFDKSLADRVLHHYAKVGKVSSIRVEEREDGPWLGFLLSYPPGEAALGLLEGNWRWVMKQLAPR